MRIGLDVDGVLASFESGMIPLIKTVTGRDLFPPDFSIQVWDWPEALGYTRDEMATVWAVIQQDWEFWYNLDEHKGAITLRERWGALLAAGHTVVFATNRLGATAGKQTQNWLRRAGCPGARVTVTGHKGIFCFYDHVDCYLDDKLSNIQDVVCDSPATRAYLLTWPHNAAAEPIGFTRVPTVAAFFEAEGL